MKTEAAKTSSVIKKELKNSFHSTKFSVKSDTFAGGDSVNISWTDGPTTDEVENIVKKYQYGNFDGMTDMYNYTNTREDIPQVKYVMTNRRMSEDICKKIIEDLKNYYEACKNITADNLSQYIPELQSNVQTLVYKKFTAMSLI